MFVDARLGSPAVRLLVGKNGIVAAQLTGPDVIVHTAVEVLADADINHLAGAGIDNAVFALCRGDLGIL